MVKLVQEQLIAMLLRNQVLTRERLEQAIQVQKRDGGQLSKILVKQGLVKEEDLLAMLSGELKIPPISLSRYKIDPAVLSIVPERLARQHRLIPISMIGSTLMVAMADPLNILAVDDLQSLTQYKIDPVLSTEEDVLAAIDRAYQHETSLTTLMVELDAAVAQGVFDQDPSTAAADQAARESNRAPVVRMVDLVLTEALSKRASDIHLEPYEANVRVRYRIDGRLREAFTIPRRSYQAVLTRLKILAGLDITELRMPQDGRFKTELGGREIDFRVSVLPIRHGSKVVLRLLARAALRVGLDRLGFLPGPQRTLEAAIRRPYGMILLTGPTGSGKTTTLYAVLQQLNHPERHLLTIEDPVEYLIEGITQIQVRPEIGLTFAAGLRAMLRQSPDVVMIGEIRDAETAGIAIRCALTGQLVLSTLHTNDAVSAVTRLVDMGVEPFLVASSVILVGAQRLCRQVCSGCREAVVLDPAVLASVRLTPEQAAGLVRGRGCRQCQRTGYYGRIAILEVLEVDELFRQVIAEGRPLDELRAAARSRGMRTLRENGLEQCCAGVTTLEEVLRVTADDDDRGGGADARAGAA